MPTMAPLQKMFHTILAASSPVTTIVGLKIEPDRNSEDYKPPMVRVEIADDQPIQDLGADAGTGMAQVRVVCTAHSRKGAIDIANVVRPALSDYRGTVNSVAIQSLAYDGADHNYEPAYDAGDEQPWISEALTFSVFYGPGGPS